MTATRVEHDSLSLANVAADKLRGARTQRPAEHLKVAGLESGRRALRMALGEALFGRQDN